MSKRLVVAGTIWDWIGSLMRKYSLRDAAILTASQGVFVLSGFFVTVALARLLSPASFGVYGVVITFLVWIETLLVTGSVFSLGLLVVRHQECAGTIVKRLWKLQVILGAVGLVVITIASTPIASLLNDPSLAPLIAFASLDLLVYGSYRIRAQTLLSLARYHETAITNCSYAIGKAALMVPLVWIGFGLVGALAGNILASVLALLVGLWHTRSVFGHGPISIRYRTHLAQAIPSTLFFAGDVFVNSADLWVVKAMIGGAEAGFYTAAAGVAKVIFFLSLGLRSMILPEFTVLLERGDVHGAIKALLKLVTIFIIGFGLLALILSRTAPWIIKLAYTDTYMPAAPILRVLVFSYVGISLAGMLGVALLSTRRAWQAGLIAMACAILTVPWNIWMIQHNGILGAATAMGVTGAVLCCAFGIVLFYSAWRQDGLGPTVSGTSRGRPAEVIPSSKDHN